MKDLVHHYEISSATAETQTYVHQDSKTFDGLLRKVLRLHRILEQWNFGLYYVVDDNKYWIEINVDKYSTLSNLPHNSDDKIPLTLGVITYPLSFEKEIWTESAVTMYFLDIYESNIKDGHYSDVVAEKKLELYAIEHMIRKKCTSLDIPNVQGVIPENLKEKVSEIDKSFSHLTSWQLMRRYFYLMEKNNFVKVTAEFSCVERIMDKLTINMTSKGMTILEDKKHLPTFPDYYGIKYDWSEVIMKNVKAKCCEINVNKKTEKAVKMNLTFSSTESAKQFRYMIKKHIWQNEISYNKNKDSEFDIIKSIAVKEQQWIEKSEELQFELSNIKAKTKDIITDNDKLTKLNDNFKNQIIELNKKIENEEKEKKDLEKKIKIFEMNSSLIENKEKIIKDFKSEIDKLKKEKVKEGEINKREQEKLVKTIADLNSKLKHKSSMRVSSINSMDKVESANNADEAL